MGPQFIVPPPLQSITAQLLMMVHNYVHISNFSINFCVWLIFKIGSDFGVSNMQVGQAVIQEAILAIWMVQLQERPKPSLSTPLHLTQLNLIPREIKYWFNPKKNPHQKLQNQFQFPNPSHPMKLLLLLHWRKPRWSLPNHKPRITRRPKCHMCPPPEMGRMGKRFMGSCTDTQNRRSALSASAMEAHSHRPSLCNMPEAPMFHSLCDT